MLVAYFAASYLDIPDLFREMILPHFGGFFVSVFVPFAVASLFGVRGVVAIAADLSGMRPSREIDNLDTLGVEIAHQLFARCDRPQPPLPNGHLVNAPLSLRGNPSLTNPRAVRKSRLVALTKNLGIGCVRPTLRKTPTPGKVESLLIVACTTSNRMIVAPP